MKIVRALWGEQNHIWKEIPEVPVFENEIVYVWGEDSQKILKDRGYETVLMTETVTEPRYSTIYDHFAHKLDVYVEAEKEFGEFLFLDWDVKIVKEIDERFWELVRSKSLQCPIYGYPSEYERKIWEHVEANPQKKWVQELDPNTRAWVKTQNELLEKYNWKFEDLQLVPNVCFFYSNNSGAPLKLKEIYDRGDVKTCIEEFAMWIFADCSLDEFIDRYEPIVIRGREDDCYHFDLEEDDTMKRVNEYVATKIKKEIYLIHV
jgi:hypothetical protein